MASIVPKLTEDVLELYADRVIRTDGIDRLRYYQEFEVRTGTGRDPMRRHMHCDASFLDLSRNLRLDAEYLYPLYLSHHACTCPTIPFFDE
jgi:hypothetical protein